MYHSPSIMVMEDKIFSVRNYLVSYRLYHRWQQNILVFACLVFMSVIICLKKLSLSSKYVQLKEECQLNNRYSVGRFHLDQNVTWNNMHWFCSYKLIFIQLKLALMYAIFKTWIFIQLKLALIYAIFWNQINWTNYSQQELSSKLFTSPSIVSTVMFS